MKCYIKEFYLALIGNRKIEVYVMVRK